VSPSRIVAVMAVPNMGVMMMVLRDEHELIL
jgi:hypothetical protein